MKSRERVLRTICVCLILCVASANLGAATVYVGDIQLSFPGLWWYDWTGGESGNFYIDASTTGSLLRTWDSPVYDYKIDADVTITCSLHDDFSSGGTGRGEFLGGATITVVGDLIEKSSGTYYVTNDTILVAQMVLLATETWDLEEDGYENFANTTELWFNPANGGLNAGITIAGGNILKIGDFRADLSFQNCGPGGVNDFSSKNIMGFANTVQITAIPEPMSALLLGFGTLWVCRKKVNK